jgi:hypothetical protein
VEKSRPDTAEQGLIRIPTNVGILCLRGSSVPQSGWN